MKSKLKLEKFKLIERQAKKIHAARRSRDSRRNDLRSYENCLVGLLGESLANRLTGIGSVNLTVYQDGHEKRNFDGDLSKHLHVKTCNLRFQDTRYDSWTMDKKDPLCKNPENEDVIILMYAEKDGTVESAGYVYATEVIDLWKPTKKIQHKVAIYRDDIEDLIKPLEDFKKTYKYL